MDQYKIQYKLAKFLDKNSGNSIHKREIWNHLIEEKPKSTSKKPKKKHTSKDNVILICGEFLSALEHEGLVFSSSKTILIKKPFRLQGKVSVSRRGEGFVTLPSRKEIYVAATSMEDAISGDKVEILPVCLGKKNRLEGVVTSIVKRGRIFYRLRITEDHPKQWIGIILDLAGERKEGFLSKKTLLKDTNESLKIGDVLVVQLNQESFQEGHLLELHYIKNENENSDPDYSRVLMKYGLIETHPKECHPNFPDIVDESTVQDWNKRVDLRDIFTVTIDGETAKDFDDAISFEINDKIYTVWVHIADVAYYVTKDSFLDQEAYSRATSVYLSNRVVPMLPPELSENLCSLVANQNRLAFTVEMEISKDGKIYKAKFYKSIINVNKRLTYDEAEKEIQVVGTNSWLYQLNQLTKELRTRRIKNGRVDLNLKEMSFQVNDKKEIISVIQKDRLDSHILIEELMLSANLKVDEFLRKKNAPSMHRVHEVMDLEKLESLNFFLKTYGFNFWMKDISYSEIQRVIALIQGHPMERIFHYLLLRSFMQAYYSVESKGHWGLGFKDYCHFTSPIRRYPDLIVHRVLNSIIQDQDFPYSEDQIQDMSLHCSEEERKAADAERDIQKLRTFRYLDRTKLKDFTGHIVSFRNQFVYVDLKEFGVEVIVDKTEFTNDYELIQRNDFSFYSKKFSKDFFVGDQLQLELDRIDFDEIKIFCKLT